MTALTSSFFLRTSSTLYCRTHGTQGSSAALIVPPLFGELIQSHRALFTLCTRLEKAGIPAMFFDPTGTGDSAGDLSDASLAQWEDDVVQAMNALIAHAGAREVILIGCRAMATIATRVARLEPMISRLVLWQPIIDGRSYLKELSTAHLANMTPYTSQTDHPDPAFVDLLGFSIPRQLVAELEGLSLDGLSLRPDQSALCLGVTMQDVSGLGRYGARVETADFDTLRGWLAPTEGIYDVMVPPEALDRTIDWSVGSEN